MNTLCHPKKMFFCICMYKMVDISEEAYKKCEIETINKGRYSWVSRRYFQTESGYSNWAVIFDKYGQNKQKYRYELTPVTEFRPRERFVRNDLVGKKLKVVEYYQKSFSNS